MDPSEDRDGVLTEVSEEVDESNGGCNDALPELLWPRDTGLPVLSGERPFDFRIAITEFLTIVASASSSAPDLENDSIDSDRRSGLDPADPNFLFSVTRNPSMVSANFESGERFRGGGGNSSLYGEFPDAGDERRPSFDVL